MLIFLQEDYELLLKYVLINLIAIMILAFITIKVVVIIIN